MDEENGAVNVSPEVKEVYKWEASSPPDEILQQVARNEPEDGAEWESLPVRKESANGLDKLKAPDGADADGLGQS